jgi:hypothetical protein
MNDWKLTLRNFFIISLKTAVGALIVESGAWLILPANFNLHDKAAIWNMAKLAIFIVGGSEAKVWVPKLLAWSQTPTQALAKAQANVQTAVNAEAKAKTAVDDAAKKP